MQCRAFSQWTAAGTAVDINYYIVLIWRDES